MNNVAWRVSGIQRVELELALQLAEEMQVAFVRYDAMRQRFVHVPEKEVRARQCLLSTEPISSSLVPPASASQSAIGRLGSWVAARVPDRFLPIRLLKIGWLAEATASEVFLGARELQLQIGHRFRSLRNNSRESVDERYPGGASGDHFLCLTLHYERAVFDEMFSWIQNRQMESTFMIYDLIPSLLPQYSTLDPEVFNENVRSLVQAGSNLLTISGCSARDIQALCNSDEINCPPISIIHLSSRVSLVRPLQPSALQNQGDFVLCVGTIEPRKNHQLLLDIWEEFARRDLRDAPTLVIAGSSGWLNEQTMHRLRATPQLREKVVFIDSPTDPELHWLYRNCEFTVFPSFYEGWGLPVTESLDAGKVCIASDRGSLLEAGEGLCIHLDPFDRAVWSDAILDLYRDRDRRNRMEEEIRSVHAIRSINDVVNDLRDIIG